MTHWEVLTLDKKNTNKILQEATITTKEGGVDFTYDPPLTRKLLLTLNLSVSRPHNNSDDTHLVVIFAISCLGLKNGRSNEFGACRVRKGIHKDNQVSSLSNQVDGKKANLEKILCLECSPCKEPMTLSLCTSLGSKAPLQGRLPWCPLKCEHHHFPIPSSCFIFLQKGVGLHHKNANSMKGETVFILFTPEFIETGVSGTFSHKLNDRYVAF